MARPGNSHNVPPSCYPTVEMGLKTRPTNASVSAYLAAIEDESRRADCQTVAAIMSELSGEKARMWGSMVGFGTYDYDNTVGGGTFFRTGFASRKQYLTVYVMPGYQDLSELLAKLGPHKLGKSCLYLKRLADIDATVLRQIIAAGLTRMETLYPAD